MTKTSTLKQFDPVEAARQIAEKAAAEIAQLETTIKGAQAQYDQATKERETILHDMAARNDRLSTLQKIMSDHEQEHRDAVLYAGVAEGTLGEKEAVKKVTDLLAVLGRSRNDVQVADKEYAEMNEKATARLAELDADIERCTTEQQQAQTRLMDVQRVRDRAITELGQSTYERLLQDVQGHQAHIDELRHQIIEVQVQKKQCLDQALATLATWPDLQRHLRNEETYEDATSRVISAALTFVERLIEDGPNIARALNVPAANLASYTWLELIEVSRLELYVNETLSGPMRGLRNRQAVLRDLHNQYIASKR